MKVIFSVLLSLLLCVTAANAQQNQEPNNPCMQFRDAAKTGELIKNGQFNFKINATAGMGYVINIQGNSQSGIPKFDARYKGTCQNGRLELNRISATPSNPVIEQLSGSINDGLVQLTGKGTDGATYLIKLTEKF